MQKTLNQDKETGKKRKLEKRIKNRKKGDYKNRKEKAVSLKTLETGQ